MKKNFEEMLGQLDRQIDESQKAKTTAEQVIKNAKETEKKATQARAQLEDAQKKYEAFETSYNAAMQMTGNKSNSSEEKKSSSFGAKEGISLALASALIFGAAGYAFGTNHTSNKDKTNTNGQKYYLDEASGKYLPYEQPLYVYNEETGEYEPYVTEFYTMDENGQYVPYEAQKTIGSKEEYNKLVDELQSTLVVKEDEFDGLFKAISNDSQLAESFINALNFYSTVGNTELVAELQANGDLGEDAGRYILINNADRVRDNILSYNIMKYSQTRTTEGFIDISDFIYDETQCELVADMEYALELIAKLVSEGKAEEANQKVDELFTSLEKGELYNVDNSTGYFVVRYIASMISDIIMNPGMNMTGVSITEENRTRAEILKGSVCDDFDQTKEGGLGNLYYRNLVASISTLIDTLENDATLSTYTTDAGYTRKRTM